MVPLKILSNVSRFKPALISNRALADLNRGLNSLNSISGYTNQIVFSPLFTLNLLQRSTSCLNRNIFSHILISYSKSVNNDVKEMFKNLKYVTKNNNIHLMVENGV